jgi:feruloyl esterase
VSNPRTGEEYYPGLEPGSELLWNVIAGPQPFSAVNDYFKYVVKQDPNWDWRTLDFDKDVELALKMENGLTAAIEPNLKDFQQRGGKLLVFHGWSDQNVPPRHTINHVAMIQRAMGGAANTDDWLRLYMVPGMNHCRGGEGPNTIDFIAAIDNWVANSQAPARITAAHLTNGVPDRTRPLCPYPQVATYAGKGSTDNAANFICKAP